MLITLAEARAQLGLEEDETADDGLIEGYIAAAAAHFESRFGIIADQAERSWSFDRFARLMVIPATPIDTETLAISYLAADGTEQALADFRTVTIGRHVRLLPAIGAAWPLAADADGVVTVTATAGYVAPPEGGAPATSDGVPADIKVAGRLAVAHWYANREAAGSAMSEMPLSVTDLLDPYRLVRV